MWVVLCPPLHIPVAHFVLFSNPWNLCNKYSDVPNPVGQGASSKANSSLCSQEISHILWNLEVHYRVHKRPTFASVLNQINPCLHNRFEVHFNIHPSTTGSSKWSLSLLIVSPPNSCMDPFPNVPRSAHLIVLYLMTRIMFGELYRSWCSSCSLLQSPVTSFHLGPNIFLSTLLLDTLRLCFFLSVCETKFHTHVRQQAISQFCIF